MQPSVLKVDLSGLGVVKFDIFETDDIIVDRKVEL